MPFNPNLFTVHNKIEILEVRNSDILRETDVFKAAKSLIDKHQGKYPGIVNWFDQKVLPDIKLEERAVYLGINNSIPVASAVVKRGEFSKFCHLHIEEELRH